MSTPSASPPPLNTPPPDSPISGEDPGGSLHGLGEATSVTSSPTTLREGQGNDASPGLECAQAAPLRTVPTEAGQRESGDDIQPSLVSTESYPTKIPVGLPDTCNEQGARTISSPSPLRSSSTIKGIAGVSIDDRGVHVAEQSQPKPKPVWRQWFAEICFCVTSLMAFTVIVAVLKAMEGYPVPELPMDITLNTFLAFFTTFSKASFMTVVNEVLSQWKWNLTTAARGGATPRGNTPLHNFEVLDGASRGPWGSWMLILCFKWRHFVTVAAVLSLLSAFTSPVTQQMIAYPLLPAPVSTNASVPFARTYTGARGFKIRDIRKAVVQGMLAHGQQRNETLVAAEPIEASCPTGSCTFEEYSSLAVCMDSADISDLLTVTPIPNSHYTDWSVYASEQIMQLIAPGTNLTAWNASISADLSLITPVSFSFMYAGRDYGIKFSEDADNTPTALSHFYLIWSNAGNVTYPGYNTSSLEPWPFRAIEVVYYFCVNRYHTQVRDGQSITEVVKSSSQLLAVPNNGPLRNVHCNVTDFRDRSYERNCDYDMSEPFGPLYLQDPDAPDDVTSFYAVERELAGTMEDRINGHTSTIGFWNGDLRPNASSLIIQLNSQLIMDLLWPVFPATENEPSQRKPLDPDDQFQVANVYFKYMSTSLSNMIRLNEGTTQLQNGTVWADTTFVAIHWGWVAFLAVEILLSYLFFAATVYRTVKLGTPVIKSSELAVILASTDALGTAVGSIEDMDKASEKARKVAVELRDGKLAVVSGA